MFACACGLSVCVCISSQELRPELLQELSLNACLNGKAFLIEHGDLLEFVGNRTECALLVLARKWGVNYQKVGTSWHALNTTHCTSACSNAGDPTRWSRDSVQAAATPPPQGACTAQCLLTVLDNIRRQVIGWL